jgi:hypothetical protein
MPPAMEGDAGRRFAGKVIFLVSLLVAAVLVSAALVLWERQRNDGPRVRPEVELGSGSFEGRRWLFGYHVGETFDGVTEPLSDGVCFHLVIDDRTGGCSRTNQPVETMVIYTGSGGDPEGLLTAEGVTSDRVARVVCGTGTEPIGETHLFEMPGDLLRPVLCLGTANEVAGRDWFAFAYDERGRQIAKSEPLPQR